MKIKLKKGERLSSSNNLCGLLFDDWISLNQGKVVDIDSIPKAIKDKIDEVKTSKKGDK